jgi:hypothetical protein
MFGCRQCWRNCDTLADFRAPPIRYDVPMGAKRVDGHDNGHTAQSYGKPVGVECEGCRRRALVPVDRLGSLKGNMRPLQERPLKCSGCGSRDVSLWLFAKRAEADGWAEESGPGF